MSGLCVMNLLSDMTYTESVKDADVDERKMINPGQAELQIESYPPCASLTEDFEYCDVN